MIISFTDKEALESLRKLQTGFVSFKVTKGEDGKPKNFNGANFMPATYKVGDKKNNGWFITTDEIIVERGVADPANTKDKRNESKTRNNISTKKSLAGTFGTFLHELNPIYKQAMNDLTTKIPEGAKTPELLSNGRPIKDLLTYIYSENNKENPLGKIDDPFVNFKLPEGNFSASYKPTSLANTPKVVVYDFDTAFEKTITDPITKEQKKVIDYKLAMVVDADGKKTIPVTVANIHLFLTDNSKIMPGSRFIISSANKNSKNISMPVEAYKLIIKSGASGPSGFSDDYSFTDMAAEIAKLQPKTDDDTNNNNTSQTSQASQASQTSQTSQIADAIEGTESTQ